jgi:hypothetical protein
MTRPPGRRREHSLRIWLATAVIVAVGAASSIGCGSASRAGSVRPTSTLSIALLGELFPRTGAEWSQGQEQLEAFSDSIQSRTTATCMKKNGFPALPLRFPAPSIYGTTTQVNLNAVRAHQSFGWFNGLPNQPDPTGHMTKAEGNAYKATLTRCASRVDTSLVSPAAQALAREWQGVVAQVDASAPMRAAGRKAAACSKPAGFASDSIEGEYREIQGRVLLPAQRGHIQEALQRQSEDVKVFLHCFGPLVDLQARLLAKRRIAFFSQNATAIQAAQRDAVKREQQLESAYGVKFGTRRHLVG